MSAVGDHTTLAKDCVWTHSVKWITRQSGSQASNWSTQPFTDFEYDDEHDDDDDGDDDDGDIGDRRPLVSKIDRACRALAQGLENNGYIQERHELR